MKYECDSKGTRTNFKALNRAVSSVRCCAAPEALEEALEGWDEEIREDYQKRRR